MKSFVLLFTIVAAVSAQDGYPNLNTMQGVQQLLQYEQLPQSAVATTNCILNGEPCSPCGGQRCCLSPWMSCQRNPRANGASQCMVVTDHRNHIDLLQAMFRTYGISTVNPLA